MGCVSIPFRRLPHQPKLFVQLIEDFASVSPFYAHAPNLNEVKRVAAGLDFPVERRREVVAILRQQNEGFGAGAAVQSNLGKLERGAVAVVSGQQVGLFSGPAYAIYKALTAIQIAEELRASGIEAVPIFWMATEDHDLDEVRHVTWFDNGNLVQFELPGDGSSPVGDVRLGPAIHDHVKKAAGLLSGPASETLSQILEHSYRPEETYGSAFGKLFARLFAAQGLILLDPLDARLHRVAAPLYSIRDGVRQAIATNNGKLTSGENTWTREEALGLVEAAPETFSANALLRPVVQDYLLPTVAFLGGPAEIAYLAQSSVIYQHMLGRMPVILPRAGFTILDPRAEKLLQKYGLLIEIRRKWSRRWPSLERKSRSWIQRCPGQ